MYDLNTLSERTIALLSEGPTQGSSHLWLARVAGGLSKTIPKDVCRDFLRRCCPRYVLHRSVPDREIEDALDLAYGDSASKRYTPGTPEWPPPCQETINRVIERGRACFDIYDPPELEPRHVLPKLFGLEELICTGTSTHHARVRPLNEVSKDAHCQQFLVPNPMKGFSAVNKAGKPSPRCQANIMVRRHIVAEFDDPNLTKEMQAKLVTALGGFVHLSLVVDSGGKSLHAWYLVEGLPPVVQVQMFALACIFGADPSRWDSCGWLRMPGGVRTLDGARVARQRILYFSECGGGLF